jgi:hypothetical protein
VIANLEDTDISEQLTLEVGSCRSRSGARSARYDGSSLRQGGETGWPLIPPIADGMVQLSAGYIEEDRVGAKTGG